MLIILKSLDHRMELDEKKIEMNFNYLEILKLKNWIFFLINWDQA